MEYCYFVLKPNGEVIIMYQPNKEFDFKTLQKGVGGYIEIVRPVQFIKVLGDHDLRMIVDDEGKLKGKPVNKIASLMYSPFDIIVGDAILCTEIMTDEGPDVGLFHGSERFHIIRYIKKICPQAAFIN